VLENFDKDEYSTDVNATLKIELKLADSDDKNLTYIKFSNNQTANNQIKISNKEYEINYTIKDSNFSKGVSTIFGIKTYIKKDISTPNSPIQMRVVEVNTTNKNVENVGKKVDDNITYYYPKLATNDIVTIEKTDEINHTILVYDKNKTDANTRFSKEDEILIDWYLNKQDNTQIISYEMREGSIRDTKKIDIDISQTSANGYINFKIDNNTTPPTKKGVVHIDTPLYLWYSKYNKKYDYSDSSSCIAHYCFRYDYTEGSSNSYDVGSGHFKGSETNSSDDSSRHGVKLYR
jgi:hypothetical protein